MSKLSETYYVANNQKVYVSKSTRDLIDKLLRLKNQFGLFIRVTGVSEKWLQEYVNNKYANVSQSIKCTKKKQVS